jgi:type IV pilus assembly protein PilE
MRKYFLTAKVKAFTLTEVLVVIIIIGLLVFLALPNLMPLITKAKSLEAKEQLGYLYTLEKTYYMEHSKYTDDMSALGFIQSPLVSQENGKANYQITITEAGPTTFIATATSVTDFDGDGVFNTWQIDQNQNITETIQD